MATKKDIFVVAMALCEEHKASKKLVEGLTNLLAPKAGGAKVDVDSVMKDGKLLCAVSNVWLPATLEFFYEDKSGKSPFNGLRRLSRQAESIRKTHAKQISVSEKAIMSDVLDGSMTPEAGKAKVEALKNIHPDYSSVSAVLTVEEEAAE